MADLLDYLDWRGDIPFSTDPFNYVDALILAELAYVDFAGIVPGPENGDGAHPYVSIDTVAQEFWKRHTPEEIERSEVLFRRAPLLLKKLCSGVRFGGMYLAGYTNRISAQKNEQMAALVFYLEDGSAYAAFRGTDDTVIGWKEDFSFSFRKETSGQTSAAQYLSEVFGKSDLQRIRVGGHSKGGNLAVYAGVRASYRTRRKILEIYNHDGPGFYDLNGLGDAYEEMLPRIHSFVPETAVVGLLLEQVGEHNVVKSNNKGLMQHDAMSWEVLGPEFVTVTGVSDTSRMVNDILKNWLKEISNEERATFVDTVYKILDASQAKSIDDLNAEKGRIANVVLRELGGLDKETKAMLGKMLASLVREGNQVIKSNMNSNKLKNKK